MEQSARPWRPRWVRAAALAAAALAAPAAAGELAFAYADATGRRLVAPADLVDPAQVRQALCPGNELPTIRFLGARGRAAAAGRARPAAAQFELVDAEVSPGDTCLLAPPGYFRAREPLAFESLVAREDRHDECSEALRARLAAARQRTVLECWPLALIGDEDGVYAVLFEHRRPDAPAALALDRGARLSFRDVPGERRAPAPASQAADGSAFDPAAFAILFLVEGPQGVELGVERAGAEGASVELLYADGPQLRVRLTGFSPPAP